MSSGPLIGICAVREEASWAFWRQTVHLVADTYVAAVQATGALPVILPVDPRHPTAILERLDGLLAIGGADVDPSSYGAERDPATEATYPERDAFEIAMIRAAVERDLPFLGICRGMQILNVALGGTLIQSLADEEGRNPHRRVIGSFDDVDNMIELEPGSLVARAAGTELYAVPCHHHQAVGELGHGLRATGRAQLDGITEAVEAPDRCFVLGVQWHPEATEKRELFEVFADAAAGRALLA